jgi:hypothetical protein
MLLVVKVTPQTSENTIADVKNIFRAKGFRDELDLFEPPNGKGLYLELHDGPDPKKFALAEIEGWIALIRSRHSDATVECYTVAEEIRDSIRQANR